MSVNTNVCIFKLTFLFIQLSKKFLIYFFIKYMPLFLIYVIIISCDMIVTDAYCVVLIGLVLLQNLNCLIDLLYILITRTDV